MSCVARPPRGWAVCLLEVNGAIAMTRPCAVLLCLLGIGVLAESAAAQSAGEIRPIGRRVVGGQPTDIKQHPWQVALDIKVGGRSYLCGGSVIAERWVLTAAHCLPSSTAPGHVRVKAGATNYATEGTWSAVERVVVHAAYDPATHEHDIALLKLVVPSQGRDIRWATSALNPSTGQPLEVTGWGATSEGGSSAVALMKAMVPVADSAACNAPDSYNGAIKPGMMCAGQKDVDSCQGDSGGPLVWRTADGPVLVGVVSWGEGCGRQLKYGVYTRVSSYANWIAQMLAAP